MSALGKGVLHLWLVNLTFYNVHTVSVLSLSKGKGITVKVQERDEILIASVSIRLLHLPNVTL